MAVAEDLMNDGRDIGGSGAAVRTSETTLLAVKCLTVFLNSYFFNATYLLMEIKGLVMYPKG